MKTYNLILATIIISLFSCNTKKGNFQVRAPQGWIRFDTLSASQEKKVKMLPATNRNVPIFIENINIAIMHFSNLSLYIDKVIDGVKEKAFYFKEEGEGIRKINEYNMYWRRHIIQQDRNCERMEQIVYFIKDGRNIYQIVCSSKANEMPQIQNEIDEVLKSFKIL